MTLLRSPTRTCICVLGVVLLTRLQSKSLKIAQNKSTNKSGGGNQRWSKTPDSFYGRSWHWNRCILKCTLLFTRTLSQKSHHYPSDMNYVTMIWGYKVNSSSSCTILIYNASCQIYIKAVRVTVETGVTFFLPSRQFSPNKMALLNLNAKIFILTFCHLYIRI